MADENIPQAPAPGTPEYDAAMAAKLGGGAGDDTGGTADAGANTDRPDWLPEKFKTVEDMAKAYSELEGKLGTKPEEGSTADDAAQKAVESAGLNLDTLSEEFATSGKLSDASYEALSKAGIPKEVVDMYIEGQSALTANLQNAAFSVVGGEESYNSMMSWAATNLSEAEINSFNQAVNSTKADVVKLAVAGLKSRYESVNGKEPNLTGGDNGEVSGQSYESWAQVTQAMRDPRYHKDPAYRRQVEEQLARSNPI